MNCVIETVRDTIRKYAMADTGDRVLCAVSGGADSVCMLLVLDELSRELGITVYAAHLNHGIRGGEAKRDEDFVRELCEKRGIPLICRAVSVPDVCHSSGEGEEECGRRLRYEFFDEAISEIGGGKIATAHNLSDNAETVLFRLVRGCGITGLCGIPAVRGNIIRPLIECERRDIEDYLNERNQPWCEDATNGDNKYSRNKIRNAVLPVLNEVSAAATRRIVETAQRLAKDAAFLDAAALAAYEKTVSGGTLDIDALMELDEAVRYRVAQKYIDGFGGGNVSELYKIASGTGKRMSARRGTLENQYGKIRSVSEKDEDFSFTLDAGGEVSHLGFTLRAHIEKKPPKDKSNTAIVLDADKVFLPLLVRNRREGDRIDQKGLDGTKKLQDIFTDKKIPREVRDSLPVIVSGSEIIFVPTAAKTKKFAPDENTRNYLVIEYF